MINFNLPDKIKEARRLNRTQFERIANKYLHMDFSEIEEIMAKKKKNIAAIDFIVLSVIYHAIKDGDPKRLDFLLNRTIGQTIKRVAIQSFEEPELRDIPVEMTPEEKIQMAERYALKMRELEARKTIDVQANTISRTDEQKIQRDD